ncbi:MAG TPA: hypothetical protein VK212_09640, partial [Lentimicrobium sp.]|nr:hypothetical protein [Lentimicrobium sp.]
SNVVAGIGRGQLKVINERVAARRANFERYKQYFESLEAKGYHIGFQGEKLSAVSSQLSAENKEQRTPRPGSGTTKNKEHIPEPSTRPDLSGTQNSEHYFSNRWLTTIIIDPAKNKGLTREDLRLAFEADNIESRPLWKPMHLQPVFADCPFFSSQLSAISFQLTSGFRNQESGIRNKMPSLSGQLFNHGLCLPSGSNLTEKEWGRIFSMLDTVFK